MTIYAIINDAIYSQTEIVVELKDRVYVVGVPHAFDEFDTDEDRLGVEIWVNENIVQIVFLDEIMSVSTIANKVTA